jgi:hypothetical protein
MSLAFVFQCVGNVSQDEQKPCPMPKIKLLSADRWSASVPSEGKSSIPYR